MIALEAIREALVMLEYDIENLEVCVENCTGSIGTNNDIIYVNDHLMAETDIIIEKQQ